MADGRSGLHSLACRAMVTIVSRSLSSNTMLDNATDLKDLLAPAGNRLERLKGDRVGQHSIRINDQWRICFLWKADGPHDVEITDYH